MSSVKDKLRHRFEGARLREAALELRVWFEDSSVTKGGAPSSSIFCRIAHSLIFGAYVLRSKNSTLPLEAAFSSRAELKSVTMTYFAVLYKNQPNLRLEGTRSSDQDATHSPLRVTWEREEQIIPFLSLTISRAEWTTLSSRLKKYRDLNLTSFKESACESILRITPNLRANFSALTPQANDLIDLTVIEQNSD